MLAQDLRVIFFPLLSSKDKFACPFYDFQLVIYTQDWLCRREPPFLFEIANIFIFLAPFFFFVDLTTLSELHRLC